MANNAFLKIDGIIGPVTTAGHYGEIEILAFSFSGQQSAAPSKPQPPPYDYDTLDVVKKFDSISNRLVQAVATGDHFGTVALTLEGAEGKNAGVRFITYIMTDVVFTQMRPGNSTEDGSPTESLAMSWIKLEVYQLKK